MNLDRFRQLYDAGLISEDSYKKVTLTENNRLFSVHWELRTLLYLGILLLSGGLGTLVYKHIDTIGHDVIIGLIAIVCGGCFFYAQKHKLPFSWSKVAAPNSFFDYILLLGCFTLITLVAYVQFQYNLFGSHYGLAVFIPMLGLFFSAYYFDHLGVLSMAITNLAAWVGIALTPLGIIRDNAFEDPHLIYKGVMLGVALALAGWVSHARKMKAHFGFTYSNFGMHLLFIAAYAGMYVQNDFYFAWFFLIIAIAAYYYQLAMREQSFYFLVVLALYAYVAISTFLVMSIFKIGADDIGWIYLTFIYFIGSAVGLILLLIKWHKKIKRNDHL